MSDPVITTHPTSVVVARGENTTLTVAATGAAPLYYFWQKNGAFIEGANDTTYEVVDVQDTNRYRCLVQASTVGATMSNQAEVLVLDTVALREGVGEYDEIADLVASGTTTWEFAYVKGWEQGDGVKTYWVAVDDDSLTANGTDILETAGGRIVVRVLTRAVADGEPTVPLPGGTSWVSSRPEVFANLTNFRNSTVQAALVILKADANGDLSFFEYTTSSGTDDGVNHVVNASGDHYQRL